MPKKRRQRALLIKPSSSRPTTFAGQAEASPSQRAPSTSSVNDLLRQSRRSNARPSLHATSTASLPPVVRQVLALPLPTGASPRTNLTGPSRFRRIPGPPPPQSWLIDSRHADLHSVNTFQRLRWTRARIQQVSSILPGLELPAANSLQHATLKAIAQNWSWHAEYDGAYLSALPCVLRMQLLGYIAIYDEANFPNPLPLLFPTERALTGDNDDEQVTRLDLSNALGSSLSSIRKLEKELVRNTTPAAVLSEDERIPDSWEDTSLPSEVQTHTRFANLRHLSLALDPASASAPPSWASLVALSVHLSRLTSLSLGNWPSPTYTPNASRGRVKIADNTGRSIPQVFGGTDMYSAVDNDWREAAGILKSLSRNLYCLTWLDLGGCGSWWPALVWKNEDDELGPDWVGSWRNIALLILTVGWTPGRARSREEFESSFASRSSSSVDSTRAIEQLYGHSRSIQDSLAQLSELRLNAPLHQTVPRGQADDETALPWNVEHEREKQYFKREVDRYNSHVDASESVGGQIREIRRRLSGKYVTVECSSRLNQSDADL